MKDSNLSQSACVCVRMKTRQHYLRECARANLRMAQVNKRLETCFGVSCKSALFVLSLHSYTISPVVRTSSWLDFSDPTAIVFFLSAILINFDANPFAKSGGEI